MKDTIMFGVIIFGLIVWVGVYAYEIGYEWWRKRTINRQIASGVVPVDYSAVIREAATDRNNEVLAWGAPIDPKRAKKNADLLSLRTRVAIIRSDGFVAAQAARLKGEMFAQAISENPYPKGSGEAKQWARGFCQDRGHPPKSWMERA